MGACVPFSFWIPEDDALLKKAVEAGASLESLAKGAVCFSRRFTIRELRDRWLALLYDPEISAEASTQIAKLQNSDLNYQKSNRSCNSKGKESEKRKVESVRSHYYAMRKKICQQACDPIALGDLMPPSAHICIGNCMAGAPIRNHFGLPETGFDIVGQAFPKMEGLLPGANIGTAPHAFHTGHVGSLEDGLPGDIMARNCIYGFADDDISSISVENAANGLEPSFDHHNLQDGISHILGDDEAVFQSVSCSQEVGLPQTMPVSDLFGTHESGEKSLLDFDTMNRNLGGVCSGFEASRDFSLPVSDCSAQFQQLGYSSPQGSMAIWRTIEEFSPPSMPIEDKEQSIDGDKKLNLPDYNVMNSGLKLEDRVHGDGLNNSIAVSEGDLMDLSNSLLNLENEDLLYMNVGGKDMMDRSSCLDGISSMLLSSPKDAHPDEVPISNDRKPSIILATCLLVPDVVDDVGGSVQSDGGDGPAHRDLDFNVSANCSRNLNSPHLQGSISCMLNTEDTEIPCNDDAFQPPLVGPPVSSFSTQHNSEGTITVVLSTDKELPNNWKASEQGPALIKEEPENSGQNHSVQMLGRPMGLSDVCLEHPRHGYRVKTESPECDFPFSAPKSSGIGDEDPNSCKPISVAQHCIPNIRLKEDISTPDLGKGGLDSSCLENPVQVFGDCKQEADMPVAIQKLVTSDGEHGSGDMGLQEPVANFSISNLEEQLSESSDDVPYFSDVEAMILDMDLGPEDHNSFLAREAARYQNENTMKAIIRLEQGARSCMRRAAAYHGAYAVFYGRYLKYYIKKPEVSLGRATDDFSVDIDLGREGRANKISRRQAIIKMEEDGSFYLKNHGKHAILVNNKEISSGQWFILCSGCLIEIRDMRFIFETNQNLVMHYVANIMKRKSQDK